MKCSKLNMFNVQTLIVLSLVLAALVVQPTFGGNSDSGKDSGSSGSGSASVEDGKSTNSGQKGGCKLSGESKSGSGEDCQRQNETNCLISCSKESGEAENCDLEGYEFEEETTTTSLAPSTTENSTSSAVYENSTETCSCMLLDALDNITRTEDPELDEEKKDKVRELRRDCHEILVGRKCKRQGWGKFKEHRCKLKKVLKRIQRFRKEHKEVMEVCEFKEINGYGNFLQARYAMKTVCAQDSSAEIVKTETSNCTICDKLEEFAEQQTDVVFRDACRRTVFYLRIVFSYEEFDNSQRKGWAFGHIKRLCKAHPEHEQEVMDQEFGDSGDDVESFCEGAGVYNTVQGLPDILSGVEPNCPLLRAMREYIANESNAMDQRGQMKQLCDKLSHFFTINVSIKMRLSYCSSQFYQFLLASPGMKRELQTLEITGSDGETWGTCYDISFSSSFCSNFGCGNKTGGPGKFPSMSDRGRLITPDSQNQTYFETAFDEVVQQDCTPTQRQQVNSARNSMKSCIHSPSKCPSDNKKGSKCRVKCVADVIPTISVTFRKKFTSKKIKTYCGEKTCGDCCFATIGHFCGCQ